MAQLRAQLKHDEDSRSQMHQTIVSEMIKHKNKREKRERDRVQADFASYNEKRIRNLHLR